MADVPRQPKEQQLQLKPIRNFVSLAPLILHKITIPHQKTAARLE
jgi:hypothetical protein